MCRAAAVYVLLALVLSTAAWAQQGAPGVISGIVLDDSTGKPVEHANVFLAQTSIGMTTGADGDFALRNIPAGGYRLIVSQVGYQTASLRARVAGGDTLQYTVRLRQLLVQKEGVEVTGVVPADWKRLLKLFVRAFIGGSDNADKCRLLNPEVVNLAIDKETGRLVATTDSVLRMENRALGYRVNFVIQRFDWDTEEDRGAYQLYPFFRPLVPKDPDEREEWIENRKETYAGSFRHFLVALQSDSLEEEGFEVYAGPLRALREGSQSPVPPGAIAVSPTADPFFTLVAFSGWLKVRYSGNGKNMVSYLSLPEGNLVVDRWGNIADFMHVNILGDWADYRMADLLPFR